MDRLRDDALVDAVREFFDGEALCERMERWAEANAHAIDLALHPDEGDVVTEGTELPVHYGALHAEWCAMLDAALEEAVRAAGGTVDQLFGALREGQQALRQSCNEGSGGAGAGSFRDALAASKRASSLLELAVQTAEFPFWLSLMVDTARDMSLQGSSARERGLGAVVGVGMMLRVGGEGPEGKEDEWLDGKDDEDKETEGKEGDGGGAQYM